MEKEDAAFAIGLQFLQFEVLVDQIYKVVRVDSIHFLNCIGELYLVVVGDVLVIEADCSVLVDSYNKIVLVSVGLVEEETVVVEVQSELDCVMGEIHLEFSTREVKFSKTGYQP